MAFCLLVFVFITGFLHGVFTYRNHVFPYRLLKRATLEGQDKIPMQNLGVLPGRWRQARSLDEEGLTAEQRKEMDDLKSIGYFRGTRQTAGHNGITIYKKDQAYDGLNLYTSGHAPEAILMDMEGHPRHTWKKAFLDIWPSLPHYLPSMDTAGTDYWRHAHLLPEGELLAIFEGYGLVKLNKDSRVLWARQQGFHHDLDISEQGIIYVLDREARILPRYHEKHPILEDFITLLSPEGEVLDRLSILEAFENSRHSAILDRRKPFGDIFHTNALEILDGRLSHASPAFRPGNILISIRHLNTLAVIDKQTRSVVWTLVGQWREQHHPTVVSERSLLVFNNLAGPDFSEVIELDPFTQQVIWSYQGTPNAPFYTMTCGSNQRLPNGNTLVCESDNGRAFEVTPEGEVVWEFLNTHRAGRNNEMVATLFGMERIRWEAVSAWLEAS